MRDLAGLFEEAGAEEVRTYIQSGNVVFRATAGDAAKAAEQVRRALAERFGIDSPVVTRCAAEWADIVSSVPFSGAEADESKLHVVFLADAPSKRVAASLDPQRSPGDRFALRGREIYLHLPRGVARTKLTNAYFDKALGTTSTMRNWRTVKKLAELAGCPGAQ
jgi:uncharacterized protein (DUF1697 family)